MSRWKLLLVPALAACGPEVPDTATTTSASMPYDTCFQLACAPQMNRTLYVYPPYATGVPTSGLNYTSLQAAIDDLVAGDELVITSGTYNLSGQHLDLSGLHGTMCSPIRITANPGAVITARAPVAWGPPDANGVQRSTLPVYQIWTQDFLTDNRWATIINGFFVDEQNERQQLIAYPTLSELTTPVTTFPSDTAGNPRHATGAYYVGPGLYYDDIGCKMYMGVIANDTGAPIDPDVCFLKLRLTSTPTQIEVGREANAIPDVEVYIDESIEIDDSRHVTIQGLHVEAMKEIVVTDSSHVTFVDIDTRMQNSLQLMALTGAAATETDVHHIRIQQSRFTHGFPEYVYWTDLKSNFAATANVHPRPSNPGPAHRLHEPAIEVLGPDVQDARPPECIAIEDNEIRDVWWGIYLVHANKVNVANNHVERAHNEAIQFLSRGVANANLHHNLITDSKVGFTQVPGGTLIIAGDQVAPGKIYIHHNVVDHSRNHVVNGGRRHFNAYGRPGFPEPQWASNGAVVAVHGSGATVPMHIFNNTFRVDGAGAYVARLDGTRSYYLNNIIVQREETAVIARGFELGASYAAGGVHVDGEWIWRRGDGPGRPPREDYDCSDPRPTDTDVMFHQLRYEDLPGDPADVYGYRFNQAMTSWSSVTPANRRMHYRSLADFWCGTPMEQHYRRSSETSTDWTAIDQDAESGDFLDNAIYRPVGLNANYRPSQAIGVRAPWPAELPPLHGQYIGACQTFNCSEIGPN